MRGGTDKQLHSVTVFTRIRFLTVIIADNFIASQQSNLLSIYVNVLRKLTKNGRCRYITINKSRPPEVWGRTRLMAKVRTDISNLPVVTYSNTSIGNESKISVTLSTRNPWHISQYSLILPCRNWFRIYAGSLEGKQRLDWTFKFAITKKHVEWKKKISPLNLDNAEWHPPCLNNRWGIVTTKTSSWKFLKTDTIVMYFSI